MTGEHPIERRVAGRPWARDRLHEAAPEQDAREWAEAGADVGLQMLALGLVVGAAIGAAAVGLAWWLTR